MHKPRLPTVPSTAKRLLNLSLRGATLLSKFVLIFVLAKLLEPAEVGLYGLLAATVGYCLFVLGLEFYTYSMRELIASPSHTRMGILRDQVIFYLLSYAMFLPLFIALFFADFLPWEIAAWFYLLAILEHVAQELNRTLIALSLQLEASVVLFIRSGAWALTLILLMWAVPSLRDLHIVLAAWSIGAALACMLGLRWTIRKLERSQLSPVNWAWIRRGIRVALPMLIAALAIRGLFTFDRYWVQTIGGLETVGAYVLYAGIGSAVISFLDAGVVVFYYPRLVTAARGRNVAEFMVAMKSLRLNVVLATCSLTMLALGISHLVVEWLDKTAYQENFHLVKWILLSMLIYGISHTPHLGLYAQGKDRTIVLSQLAALLTFVIVGAGLASTLQSTAIPAALCAAFALMLVWKSFAYRRMATELKAITRLT